MEKIKQFRETNDHPHPQVLPASHADYFSYKWPERPKNRGNQPRKRGEMVDFEGLSFRLVLVNFFDLSEKLTVKIIRKLIFLNEYNNLASVK